ncbi:MAG: hypothetical protein HQL70_06715, partial [Magnetococcales bacterium]|nr:hypothetical protein [Magnetococcales bacterium]
MTSRQISIRKDSGFTLAQMAVVILLSGILMTMGVTTMRALNENAAVKVTKKRLEILEGAFIAFMSKNNRLPCPDTDFASIDGSGNPTTSGTCPVEVGLIPFYDLGLQRNIAMDGWENFFTYRV